MRGGAEHEERAYVYMVRCAGGQLYTGWTNDPGARLHAHKTGKGAKATRAMGAQRFAYLERCADKSAALRREAALKKLPKPKKEALCAEWEGKNLPRLSVATRADAADILEIYNWYVLNHTATFQVTPSTLEEYEDWVDNTRKVAPLLLARDTEGKLLGYACAHRWHPREAYDWSVESTIYCAPDARGLGVGTLLYRALLEVLDPEQNKTCKDNYLDIPFDLSNVLFITTANDASHIPGPLYDRMDVIELPSYTRVEKFNIARRNLLPKQLKNNGLESRVTMAPAALYEIIDGYTREAGVRTLERTITAVLRKCAQKIAAGEKDKINVTPAMVKAMLGPEKVKPTFISRTDAVGIANGLAWTSVGGEMLPIEVSIIPNGSGKVEITGSLGDVMKESAHLALTYARVHAETYHIAPDKFKNTDIHIHAPEGAVPKDGPSAGVTLTTALISALSEIPVRHDLAMTGEITLHGNVLPIGGLKEKSMAAFREGISTVLIPEANKPDLYEVDEEVKKAVKFIPVSDLSQVLKHALILPAASAAHKRTMPQATQLIATEQSTAKEPAAVM